MQNYFETYVVSYVQVDVVNTISGACVSFYCSAEQGVNIDANDLADTGYSYRHSYLDAGLAPTPDMLENMRAYGMRILRQYRADNPTKRYLQYLH